MRILRSSIYLDMYHPPLTTVVRDCDVIDTLENVAILGRQPGALLVHDIFTVGKVPIEVATMEAMKRIEEDKERNMAILFHWTIMQWRRLNPGGVLVMNKPAPLNVADIQYVLEQIKDAPGYQNFTITSVAEDGTLVTLSNGKIR